MTGQKGTEATPSPQRVLAGFRVVDMSHYLAGPQLAAVLGSLGAEVVRIDPPTGPRWNHPANAFLQRGKQSIALDLKAPGDLAIAQRLIAQADVVIENFRPGVADRLGVGQMTSLAANPRLVYCSLPGFAASDPRRELAAWEGVICAAAGIYVSRSADPNDDIVANAVPYASSFGALVGAHSVLAALVARERSGLGQYVECPLFDAVFEAIGHFGLRAVGGLAPRTPAEFAATGGASPQGGFYKCADDRWIHLCMIQRKHLNAFAERFFPPEWLKDGMADTSRIGGVDTDTRLHESDPELSRRAQRRFEKLMRERTAAEWERLINEELQSPAAVCLTGPEWLADTHARAVEAVTTVKDPDLGFVDQPGHAIRMTGTPLRVDGGRHRLDEDRDAVLAELEAVESGERGSVPVDGAAVSISGALDGFRVVDSSQVLAGPTTSRILAEYGADVIKVMSPYDGQILAHAYTNNGKRSLMLDLKTNEGRDIYLRIARSSDVVVENFSLGTTDRMGIGEEDIRRENPDVIYASVSSYGWWTGWRSRWRGREELGQAVTGMELIWGDERPRMQPFAMNDYGAGNWAAFGVLAAILHRLRGGAGQHVHSSLAHTATFHQVAHLLGGPNVPDLVAGLPHGQQARGPAAYDRLYQACDRWLYLAATVNGLPRVRAALGLSSDPETKNPGDADADEIAALIAERPAQEVVDLLVANGVGAHVVASIEDVMDDPRTRARGLSIIKDLPGVGQCRVLGPSPRLRRNPPRVTAACGAPGSDGRAVLDELGLGGQYDRLVAEGVVYPALPPTVALIGRVRAAV